MLRVSTPSKQRKKLWAKQVSFTPEEDDCLLFSPAAATRQKAAPYKWRFCKARFAIHQSATASFGCVYFSSWQRVAELCCLSYQNCGGGNAARAGKNAELCIPVRGNNKEFAYSLDWLQKWGRITLHCSLPFSNGKSEFRRELAALRRLKLLLVRSSVENLISRAALLRAYCAVGAAQKL